MTRVGQYLLIKRDALREDSWTYGDWRQYIAFRDSGEACCVRYAALPFVMAVVGFVALSLPTMGLFMWWNGVEVPWDRLGWTSFVGFLLLGPEAVLSLTVWRLVVVVLTCSRKAGGGWERDL